MPGIAVTFAVLREQLSSRELVREGGFELARALCQFVNGHAHSEQSQELVLRAREFREDFGSASAIVDGLVRDIGLFPYLGPECLPTADQIAYEAHRPENMSEDLVFHRPQAAVYHALLNGDNVVLAAPASFGKSLIIDALIATDRFQNVVIVVPTLALVDETRRRLSSRFRSRFKVITHGSQPLAERNIIVGTQERVLSMALPEAVDLLVVDEFYKLDPGRDQDEARCMLLNEAVYHLLRRAKQFYMLGPNVRGLGPGIKRLRFREFFHPYHTVVSELHKEYRSTDEDRLHRLVELCRAVTDPTLVFCRSPKRAGDVAEALLNAGLGNETAACLAAADWVARHYHPEWRFARALRKGIGIHHGRVSRALGQLAVRAFNQGQFRFLICTSTLIEGVNTTARNMMILDKEISGADIDLFTFNNIRGRSGRMFRHFVGHVYLLNPPPTDELPIVDAPALEPLETVPASLLIQIEDSDLSEAARLSLQPFRVQNLVDYETLRANDGIDPESQLELAIEIRDRRRELAPMLGWRATPTWAQLESVCDLIWRHFGGGYRASGSVTTARQLAHLIDRLRAGDTTAQMIREHQSFFNSTPDDAVEKTLHFLRNWASFHFPKLLQALNRIQADVFRRLGLPAGDYGTFAARVGNLFLPPEIAALDEYGLPIELARVLRPQLASNGDLDEALRKLKSLDVRNLGLSRFEKLLVRYAQDGL